MKMKMKILAFFAILLVGGQAVNAEPDWMRNLKRKADETKREFDRNTENMRGNIERSTQDTRRKADEAKRQFGRNTEDMRRNIERSTQGTRENLQRGIQEQTRRISEEAQGVQRTYGSQAARQIDEISRRYGSQASREMSNLYERYGGQIAEDVANLASRHGAEAISQCSAVINQHGERAGRNLMQAYDQYGKHAGAALAEAIRRHGPAAGEKAGILLNEVLGHAGQYMENEENQRKAAEAVITTAVIYSKFDSEKKRITKEAITLAANNIEVVDPHGRRTNLNRYTQEWIGTNAPYLRGTSIAEDPAEAITYGVIYGDTNYICNDMKLLHCKDGEFRSIRDTAIYESGFDADQTIAALEIADNFATLGDGEASADDLVAAAQMIERLQAAR